MRLEQLRYALAYKNQTMQDASPFILGDVFLCLNGIKSQIKIEETFTSIQDTEEDSIKGYSLLQHLLKDPADEMKSFCLQNQNGDEISATGKVPFVQFSPETYDDAEYLKLLDNLKIQCTPVAEIEPLVAEEPVAVVEEATANPDLEQAKANAELLYQKYKTKFLKAGYLLKEEGNISLFHSLDDIDDNIVIILTDTDAEIAELEPVGDGEYKYESETEVLMVTKIDDDITFQHNQKTVEQ